MKNSEGVTPKKVKKRKVPMTYPYGIPNMQQGGPVKPIQVTDPKDPRLKAYNDSLAYFNKSVQEIASLKKELEADGKTLEKLSVTPRTSIYKDAKNKPIASIDYGTDNIDYIWSIPIYKKPVQPVELVKPKAIVPQPIKPKTPINNPNPPIRKSQATKIYTDKKEFDKANTAYRDSLFSYTADKRYTDKLKERVKAGITEQEFNEFVDQEYPHGVNFKLGSEKPESSENLIGKTKGGVLVYDNFTFKKPIVKPVYQEPAKKAIAHVGYEQPPIFDIMMPTGSKISREDFIKTYGENAWKKATNQKFEQGGMINNMTEINIEKNELLVNPEDGKVLRTYTMQRPHAEGKKKEPMENFVVAPEGGVIIPANRAKAYNEGDKTRRDTILRNLKIQDSMKNKFGLGGFIGDIGKGYLNNMLSPVGYQPFKTEDFDSQGIGEFSTTIGGISKSLAPMVAGAALGPGGSMGVQAAQGLVPQERPKQYGYGGRVKKYGLGGGITDLQSGYIDPRLSIGSEIPQYNNPANYTHDYGMIGPQDQPKPKVPFDKRLTNNQESALLAGAGVLANSVGPIHDMLWTKGGKKYDKVDYGQITPNLLNYKEPLAEVDKSYADARYNVRKANPSSGGLLAAYTAIANRKLQAKAGIMEQYGNRNSEITNRTNMFNKELSMRSQINTAQNKARSEDIFRQGLGQVGKNVAYGVNDYNIGRNNTYGLTALKYKYGHLPYFDQMIKDMGLDKPTK